METFTCNICNISKNISNYGMRGGGKYRKHECKQCLSNIQKQFYVINHDIELERKKQYKELHKEKINETHKCQCGGSYRLANKTRHERTHKHMNFTNDIII